VTARAVLLFSQGDDTVEVITILGVFALSLSLGMAGTCGVLACMLHVMAQPRLLHAEDAAQRRTA
jgi:hypothetical protein